MILSSSTQRIIKFIGCNLTAAFVLATMLTFSFVCMHSGSFAKVSESEQFFVYIDVPLDDSVLAVGFDDLSFRLITESPFSLFRESNNGKYKTYEVMSGASTNWTRDLKDLGDSIARLASSYAYTKPIRMLLVTNDGERVLLIYEEGRIERI